MYLKSLEISGFKSFAEPTTIQFHQGVTAIVGPNGCGKSNVLDSIRWALGETSAKALRGAQMQDVIFGGTDSRKALGMAEVSMTFADCETQLGTEFNEMRITRRVFRDGGSEYEINKTPCRQRDVHQLFMDTGIGRSAYSIMEQGKIDLILSSKPEDRRAIFEEAAGVTRFKSQKKEALRKLEQTDANLLRVSDIIKEVRRQIGSLQRQAAKARRYQELFERLRMLDTSLARHQFNDYQGKLQSGEERVQALQLEFAELESTLEAKESQVRQTRINLENCEVQLQAVQQERSRNENQVEQTQAQISYNHQRIEEWEGLVERHRLDLSAGEEKVRTLGEELEFVSSQTAQIDEESSRLSEELSGHQRGFEEKKQEISRSQQERGQLEAQLRQLNEQLNSFRNKQAALELQQKSYLMRVEKLQEEEAGLGSRLQELAVQLADLNAQVLQREETQSQFESRLAEARQTLETERQAFAEARTVLNQSESEASRLQARVEALQKLVNSRTGYSEAARKLLDGFQGRGVNGALLDYLKARPGYEKAIELCLGAAWETLIVEDPEVVPALVAQLQGGGSAVLLDKARLERGAAPQPSRPEAAVHFVETKPEVGNWIGHLLGGHYIVDTADQAESLAAELPFAVVVTKEGEIWHPQGWRVRGHGHNQSHSILAYENELGEVRIEAGHKNAEAESLRARVEDLRNRIQHSESLVGEIQAERQQLEGGLSALRFEVKGLSRQDEEWQRRSAALTGERENLMQQDRSDQEQERELREKVEQLSAELSEKNAGLEGFFVRINELSAQVEAQSELVSDCRVRLASARQRREGLQHQQSTVESRLLELQETQKIRQREIEEYQAKIAQARESIQTAEGTIVSLRETVERLAQTVEEGRVQRQEIQAILVVIEEEARNARRRAGELNSIKSREEVSLAEHRMHRDALLERMQRTYQLDLSAPEAVPAAEPPVAETAPGEAGEVVEGQVAEGAVEDIAVEPPVEEPVAAVEAEPIDWEARKIEVGELQTKIDSMGPVNVEAITEYEELEQRLKFLEDQERDLTSSKEQLADAIKKINDTTRVLFAETFEKIKANFAEMFVELFGGGRAELSLIDSDDPLECGIEIVARPPGKQLTSITLMSGGEKTMTAVALLFAIYMVKPSPFCVLDEMDAPLDESNISRFIRILQRFVTQSQFVVITHNKRTISASDVLYGVTMEEHGISKIVSIKLARKEESPLFADQQGEIPSIADSVRGPMKVESPA